MARIAIVTSGHLSTNPRVWREADALSAAGHDVIVTGVWFDTQHAAWDVALLAGRRWSFLPAADLRGDSARSRLARLKARARSKVGRTRLRLGLGDDPHALGYAVDRLERTARKLAPDLAITHLEPGLWVAERLTRTGLAVALDIEDWYSENHAGVSADDAGRQQLARLEQRMFPAARGTSTTSWAMAHALSDSCAMTAPLVVYNGTDVPPLLRVSDNGPLALVWVSQTVGAGRGLEDLFAALRRVDAPWRLTVIGTAAPEIRRWADAQLGPAAAHVRWQSRVAPQELPAIIGAHHVGLALEVPRSLNKDLTVSNKLFHYLQGGLGVIASETAGQREVLSQVPAHGALFPAGDADALASRLAAWAEPGAAVRHDREARHAAANARFAAPVQASASARMAAHALAAS